MMQNRYTSLEKLEGQYSKQTLLEDIRKEYCSMLENSREVYIWGTGLLGKFAYEQLKKFDYKVIAFIDNNVSMVGSAIEDVSVISPEEVITEAVIIICTKFFTEIENQIAQNLNNPYLYYRVLPILDERFEEWGIVLSGIYDKLDRYRENYKQLFRYCSDETSKEVLDSILNYRFTMDSKWLKKAYEETYVRGRGIEYFDAEIITLQEDEVFVDCGGYIGDTVLKFVNFAEGKYRRIYCFEPNKNEYKKAEENLNHVRDVVLIQAGAGEKSGINKFSGMGDSGHIDDNGEDEVYIVMLDEAVKDAPTFIKMDVEGAELSALKGASKIIKENTPKLAICVYHKPEDLFEIFELIHSWGINYKYYFRHYTRGISGTVLYCIPCDRKE